jgi:hypothetical protein
VQQPELDRGEAGRRIAREYERRRRNRENRVSASHPRVGRLLLALTPEPPHQRAFHIGDLGEKAVAEALEKHSGPAVILANRLMPGARGDIDFLAVAPSGVFVIDAKAVEGKVLIDKPWFGQPRLLVGGRDRTRFIDGLDRQVATVREILGGDTPEAVSTQGVLCFTEADLPLLRTLTMRGHLLLYRRGLVDRINAKGQLTADAIERVAGRLAVALPPA